MNTAIDLIKYPLIAGVLAMAVARSRELAWWEIALSFPLGVAVYLVSEFSGSRAGES